MVSDLRITGLGGQQSVGCCGSLGVILDFFDRSNPC